MRLKKATFVAVMPLLAGCVVSTPPPDPPAKPIPPGQLRREQVHERNEEKKAEKESEKTEKKVEKKEEKKEHKD